MYFSHCNWYFDTQQRDLNYNLIQNLIKFDWGSKRHLIPSESSKNSESNSEKKTLVRPQYVVKDILKCMLNANNSTGSELENDEFDEEDENNETKPTETI